MTTSIMLGENRVLNWGNPWSFAGPGSWRPFNIRPKKEPAKTRLELALVREVSRLLNCGGTLAHSSEKLNFKMAVYGCSICSIPFHFCGSGKSMISIIQCIKTTYTWRNEKNAKKTCDKCKKMYTKKTNYQDHHQANLTWQLRCSYFS